MRPNVLIIMTDDQGPWVMGCAGTPELDTPTLDRIAVEGMRFSNFFCASPVCSPARATFLTGRMPSAHGVHDWLKSGNIDVEDGVTWCGRDRPREYLAGLKGFTDHLAAAGYVCGLSGKWHLGASAAPQKGHEYWCAHSLGGDRYTGYFIFDDEPGMTRREEYVTDLFTDRALGFLDRYGTGDRPFCLSVHYTAPHAPWHRAEQPEEIWAEYEKREFPSLPVLAPHPWNGWNPTPEQRRETIEGYFTTITAMDRNVARLLAKLDQLGIADSTLLLFTSDNGYSLGHHGIHGKGNGTFPVNMYEEAVKVPFLARLPGTVPAGAVSDSLVSHYDVLPTILEMAGVGQPETELLPGRSFAPLLRGASGGHDAVVVCDEYGPVRMNPGAALEVRAPLSVRAARALRSAGGPRRSQQPGRRPTVRHRVCSGCGPALRNGSAVTSTRRRTARGSPLPARARSTSRTAATGAGARSSPSRGTGNSGRIATWKSIRQIQVEGVDPVGTRTTVLQRPVWLAHDADAPVQLDGLRLVGTDSGVAPPCAPLGSERAAGRAGAARSSRPAPSLPRRDPGVRRRRNRPPAASARRTSRSCNTSASHRLSTSAPGLSSARRP